MSVKEQGLVIDIYSFTVLFNESSKGEQTRSPRRPNGTSTKCAPWQSPDCFGRKGFFLPAVGSKMVICLSYCHNGDMPELLP